MTTKIRKIASGLGILVLMTASCYLFSHRALAAVDDTAPNTTESWIISEYYPGTQSTGSGSFFELYNNTGEKALGWNDFVVNLPFDLPLGLDVPPVFGLKTFKPHSYKVIDTKKDSYRWLINQFMTIMYGDGTFTEIGDALDEKDGYSYQRCQSKDTNGRYQISDKFYYGPKTSGDPISCDNPKLYSTDPDDRPEAGLCQGLKLNEIGAHLDEDEQFVEVTNTADELIDLSDCYLSTDPEADNKTVRFPEVNLSPGDIYNQPIADTDLPSGLTKTKGTVFIIDSDGATVIDYKKYKDTKEETSFALDPTDSTWHNTYQITPGAENIIQEYPACAEGEYRDETTHRCRKIVDEDDDTDDTDDTDKDDDGTNDLTPCKAGYERNPETNRCRKVASATDDEDELAPCPAGQYRNPATNRCKKIEQATTTTTTSTALVPCKEGYERNPETNRCRKIASAATTALTPCKDGYERNPATNRCVKKTTSSSAAKYPVKTTTEPSDKQNQSLLIIIGGVIVACTGVVIWQYRSEISRGVKALLATPPQNNE